jgi:transposase-like protein
MPHSRRPIMSVKHAKHFRLEAARTMLSSGLPRAQTAGDLGVGISALSTWRSQL